MVYRGKPSAGCENCRKAKKRCDLEQPACSRCVKLKKTCSGYRDTTQLQIQDESEAVKNRANRQKIRSPVSLSDVTTTTLPVTTRIENGIASPDSVARLPHSSSPSSSGNDAAETLPGDQSALIDFSAFPGHSQETVDQSPSTALRMLLTPKQKLDDVATSYFFSQFTANDGHWSFLRQQAIRSSMSPVIQLAVRACGGAALDNVRGLLGGREYSRRVYAEALGLLNTALRDPKQFKSDESLIAVTMLSYYENLICESRESIQSWKTHICGSTHLLKLRGKSQFKTPLGRMLFRETRAQILIHCMWDDLEPPPFLWEWQLELQRQTTNYAMYRPTDEISLISFEFASLRSRMSYKTISDREALDAATRLGTRMVQWSVDTMNGGKSWFYYEVEVPDSAHVWNGVAHVYGEFPAAAVWNNYRSIRIILGRVQEHLIRRLKFPPEQEKREIAYLRTIRRQMADDICAAIPHQLGNVAPASSSASILVAAYQSIWPLFFAGTCTLERISLAAWNEVLQGVAPPGASAAAAQTHWIIGRMKHISRNVGLRLADSMAALLSGDLHLHGNRGLDDANMPKWLKKVEKSGRGPRILIETESPLSDALDRPRSQHGPVWLGRSSDENPRPFIEAASDDGRKNY